MHCVIIGAGVALHCTCVAFHLRRLGSGLGGFCDLLAGALHLHAAAHQSMLPGSSRQEMHDNVVFQKLVLTDLAEVIPNVQSEAEIRLQQVPLRNVHALRQGGAQGPLFGYSGFEDEDDKTYMLYTELGKQINKTAGLTIWGSPHWSTAPDGSTESFRDSNAFKTNAFESMSWNSNTGFILMTFGEEFKPEFWHPKYNARIKAGVQDTRVKRSLLVTEGFFREYKPLRSGTEFHYVKGGEGAVMVAMLVPGRFKHCVAWKDDLVDVGLTMLNIMCCLTESEYAIELGGQSFGMAYEMVLALKEKE